MPGYPGHVCAAALLIDVDHCTTARRVPTESLYVQDATDLMAAAKEQVCTVLPAADRPTAKPTGSVEYRADRNFT